MSLAFPDHRALEPMHVPDAEVLYAPHVDFGEPDQAILAHLIETIPWRSESIVLWGKSYVQPRLIAWYGDEEASYTYSGLTLAPLPWTPTLMRIKQRVEDVSETLFNSVLLNYYRDGQDSMGFHSDDEPELGPAPIIASVSFGEERTFVLKHKRKKNLKPMRLPLASGSVLLMRGETQKNWRHAVEKENCPCGPRINLTLRRIIEI
jgi:alkylated DNA repair dioxygenase AlkB